MIDHFLLQTVAKQGLTEDLFYGDRTTETIFPRPIRAYGDLIAKEDLIVSGLNLFRTVFDLLDSSVRFDIFVESGQKAKSGSLIGRLTGDGRALLKGERVALNFLQHLCGVATLTRKFVQAVSGTKAKIADTRKTLPGLRALEKESVLHGGGYNHRFHLGDLILIKDNHIALARGIVNAVKATRATLSHPLKIEVEAQNLDQVDEAIQSGCEIIMLDNMSLFDMKKAVVRIRQKAPQIEIEASGGVRLGNVAAIAKCGVNWISVGSLTHSAPACDISLTITGHGTTKTRSATYRSRHPKSPARS